MNKNFFKNKVFLITGGTGSFGKAMCARLLQFKVKEIRIFSRDEKKQDDMRKELNSHKLKFYLGDIRDKVSLKTAVSKADYIFHAAALKQVPSCEFYPMEAVKTNIIGIENLLNIAIEANVKKIICLSTDKAVYPINAMGVSKSMMEKVVVAKARELEKSQTKVCITRYGNVIGSRGSVIPLFISKILKDEPLHVTDLLMTRFMMSISEALDLVLFAFSNGSNGDIFIQKSPASTIKTIVDAISKIFNKKPIVKIIGPRHGEKFHETLMTKEEHSNSINYKKYFKIQADIRDLNYEKFFTKGKKPRKFFFDYSSDLTRRLNVQETIKILKPLIKNFQS